MTIWSFSTKGHIVNLCSFVDLGQGQPTGWKTINHWEDHWVWSKIWICQQGAWQFMWPETPTTIVSYPTLIQGLGLVSMFLLFGSDSSAISLLPGTLQSRGIAHFKADVESFNLSHQTRLYHFIQGHKLRFCKVYPYFADPTKKEQHL